MSNRNFASVSACSGETGQGTGALQDAGTPMDARRRFVSLMSSQSSRLGSWVQRVKKCFGEFSPRSCLAGPGIRESLPNFVAYGYEFACATEVWSRRWQDPLTAIPISI